MSPNPDVQAFSEASNLALKLLYNIVRASDNIPHADIAEALVTAQLTRATSKIFERQIKAREHGKKHHGRKHV